MVNEINHQSLLKIDNLSVYYDRCQILSDIQIEIKKNEIVSLIGKSGVGKSTLIRAINSNIKFIGTINTTEEKRTVYQEDNLLNWFDGFRNISIALDFKHLRKAQVKREVINICEKLGIMHLLKKYPYQMSGGERKRIAIARAYVSKPNLILMDEPFSSLDIFTKDKMHIELLNIWNSSESSIFFITHDIEEAIILSDRVIVMSDMKIITEYKIHIERPRTNDLKYTDYFIKLRKNISNMLKDN